MYVWGGMWSVGFRVGVCLLIYVTTLLLANYSAMFSIRPCSIHMGNRAGLGTGGVRGVRRAIGDGSAVQFTIVDSDRR